eukprot:365998-Chlamydomonas_euryale.AAC.15
MVLPLLGGRAVPELGMWSAAPAAARFRGSAPGVAAAPATHWWSACMGSATAAVETRPRGAGAATAPLERGR